MVHKKAGGSLATASSDTAGRRLGCKMLRRRKRPLTGNIIVCQRGTSFKTQQERVGSVKITPSSLWLDGQVVFTRNDNDRPVVHIIPANESTQAAAE